MTTVARFVVAIVGTDDGEEPYCQRLEPCVDEDAVRAATKNADEYGRTWSIFEVVDGRYVPRSMAVREIVTIS